MRFDIMTLFPDLVSGILNESIIGRAQKSGAIEVNAHNIRDYSKDKHRRVDDTPYGGGKGMLMMAPPIYDCYQAIVDSAPEAQKRRVVYLSPRGKVFDQKKAQELATLDQLILLCGHYEGVDTRIIEEIVDEEISIGDFVLTGGELPACLVVDAVARLVEGVLADPECYEKESFSSGLLEYPQYTRPVEFHGRVVPDVLLSGHHANIEKWRTEQAFEITRRMRPELLEQKD
ncbi:MAG: tRNA (guanosine(37)-N1)-methyltransferase TrmD [Clostridia bacterium]|nr:tRNA (guanosine(37)-N1)-methyltransferase TrmD [Clostridia bacterium]MBQ8716942.1 tRNA (guanosine(37)-N1)-methyltransferase TrmD [Clostridia bacterium]